MALPGDVARIADALTAADHEGAGFVIIAAHNRRHLWQARQVRRAPGFPPS